MFSERKFVRKGFVSPPNVSDSHSSQRSTYNYPHQQVPPTHPNFQRHSGSTQSHQITQNTQYGSYLNYPNSGYGFPNQDHSEGLTHTLTNNLIPSRSGISCNHYMIAKSPQRQDVVTVQEQSDIRSYLRNFFQANKSSNEALKEEIKGARVKIVNQTISWIYSNSKRSHILEKKNILRIGCGEILECHEAWLNSTMKCL